MLNILPIGFVTEHDQSIFGAAAFKLAKLKRLNLSVADGFVVAPPEFVLETVLKHFKDSQKEVFEQKLVLVKDELGKLQEPREILDTFKDSKWWYLDNSVVSRKDLWKKLMEIWLEQIKYRIWNFGFEQGINNSLSSVMVFNSVQNPGVVKSYFDEEKKEVIIETLLKLTLSEVEYLKKTVSYANNKLFLPHEYIFLKLEDLQLVSVKEYTHKIKGSTKSEVIIPEKKQEEIRSSVKVFIDASSGFANLSSFEGVLIRGEEIYKGLGINLENLIFKLQDAAATFSNKPIIFRLPDLLDDNNIRGSLRLLYQKNVLNECIEAIQFLRNKKNILNINLGFPVIRDSEELVSLKQELAAKGIHRKGSLTFWLEIAVPENIINLDKYIDVGFDGAILNLDILHAHLGGYHVDEGQYYKHQILTLFEFLKPLFKSLHKVNIPVLAYGNLVLHPEVLDFLVEMGVWGVVSNNIFDAQSLPEHLNLTEKRVLNKKTLQSVPLR